MEKVIVTPRSLSKGEHPAIAKLRAAGFQPVFPAPGAQPTAEQLETVIADAVGYLAGVEKIDATLIGRALKLKVISRNGTGVDNIDLEAASARGIVVRRAEGANARGVAELAFGHILGAARQIPFSSAELKAGRWTRKKGFELEGRTLSLIGCGRVGKLVAGFALAFGMDVLAYDPYPDTSFKPSSRFSFVGFDEAIARGDVVSLHSPARADGAPLIDLAAIARMKKGVVLVNTARESLVDKAALIAALDSGQIAVYTLDAFDREPPVDEDIQRHPGVIATPHIGGFTDESVDRAATAAVDNLLEELAD